MDASQWVLTPPDMQQFGAGLARSSIDVLPVSETNPVGSGMKVHSFAGELWQSMKRNVELQRDKIQLNFLKSKDLTTRRTPVLCQQYKYFVVR